MNKPKINAPSSGFSSALSGRTPKSKMTSSIGIVYFLAKFCRTPVKKPYVK